MAAQISNHSYNESVYGVRDEWMVRVELSVLGSVFAVTVLGNACVLLALRLRHKSLSRMLFFVMHLSIADLQVAFFQTLPQLGWDITYHFQGGDLLCRGTKYLQIFSMYLSTFMLVVTALDRYLAICSTSWRNNTWTKRHGVVLVAAAYVTAAVLSVPQAVIFRSYTWREADGTDVTDCWAVFVHRWGELTYVLWFTAAVYLVPLTVIIFCYVRICCTIRRSEHSTELGGSTIRRVSVIFTSSRSVDSGTDSPLSHECVTFQHVNGNDAMRTRCDSSGSRPATQHCVTGMSKPMIKTIKLTLVVVVCYVICWSPFFFGVIYTSVRRTLYDDHNPGKRT